MTSTPSDVKPSITARSAMVARSASPSRCRRACGVTYSSITPTPSSISMRP